MSSDFPMSAVIGAAASPAPNATSGQIGPACPHERHEAAGDRDDAHYGDPRYGEVIGGLIDQAVISYGRAVARRPVVAVASWSVISFKTRSREAGKEANMHAARQLLASDDVRRTLVRVAHEIFERNPGAADLALVGIHTRGIFVAQRLQRLLADIAGVEVPLGTLDISFHRDDVNVRAAAEPMHVQPVVRGTRLDFPIDGRTIVLCDDVLYTGRTIKAAIEALFEFGRPGRVQLAVLVDRGHRELPIRPDFVGKNLPTAPDQWVRVELVEHDEVDRVLLMTRTSDREPAAAGAMAFSGFTAGRSGTKGDPR